MRTPDVLTPDEIMGTAQRTARTSSNGGRTGRFHRFATWRIDRLAMGGCGLREPRNPCSPFRCDDGPGRSQDGSFRKGCSHRRCIGRVSSRARLVGPYNRETDWVFASPTMKGKQPLWPETLWRRYGRPAVKAAKIQKRVGFHTLRHYVHNFAHAEQRGSEGGTGAPTSCEQSHYAGSLRSGGYAEQEAGTKQTCSDGAQQGRGTGQIGP